MSRSLLAVCLLAAPLAAQPRTDPHGDPLPDGALVRFGTIRYRIGTVGPYALSPDGKTVAVETARELTLWDVDTGRPVRTIPISGHRTDRLNPAPLAFSPDGEHLVRVLHRDLRVFDACTGRQRHTLELPDHAAALAFFPGGPRLAVFGAKNQVWVYDVRTGLRLSALTSGHPVRALSPGGRYFFRAVQTDFALLDAATGRVVHRLHNDHLIDPTYALSPDDRRLYAFVPRGFLFAYDLETGKLVEEMLRPPGWKLFPGPVELAVAADGSVAYLAQSGQRTCRRDLRTGRWLDPLPVMPAGRLLPHPDGRRLLLVGTDGLLRRYDLATGRELPPPDGFVDHLAAVPSPTGRLIAILSGDEAPRIDLFDNTGKRLWTDGSQKWWPSLHWPPDGRRLVTLDRQAITFRDPLTGKPDRVLDPPGSAPFNRLLAFSPDGRTLVAPHATGFRVAVYDLATGGRQVRDTGARGAPAVSPDGRTLALSVPGADPTLVDLRTGQVLVAPPAGYPDLAALIDAAQPAFSPDGGYLLTWEQGGAAWEQAAIAALRDPVTTRVKARIATGERFAGPSAFSPDGLWLATGSADGRVALWDVPTGRQVWAADGHRDAVTGVAFAGPGRLVSASQDRTVLLWDLRADRKPTGPLWEALSGDDAREAYGAVWALAADPAGPALLRQQVPRPARPDQVKRWLTDLDANRYAVREAASRALQDQARSVEPDLRAARAAPASEEVHRRLDALLARLTPERTGTERAHARAVAALELAATDAARQLLAEWAAGPPAARLTTDARAALARLASGGP